VKIEFHPQAILELDKTVDYYEEIQSGLGFKFMNEIQIGINTITNYPHSWQKMSESTRRYIIRKFPFGIIYMFYSDRIYIIAIMHLSRKPEYWSSRNQQ